MKKRQIKIWGYLILISFSFVSCDPGYYVTVSNHSKFEQQVKVMSMCDTIKIYESGKEKEFSLGEMSKKIPNNQKGNYLEVNIPSNQILMIDSNIGLPDSKLNVIINNDTIYMDRFSCKRKLGGFLGSRYEYIIKD